MTETKEQLADLDRVSAIERPHRSLWTYYLLSSMLLGPLFFIPLIFLNFRYRTLRYRFDDEGVTMRWGVLFRREVHLNYARIQDIHLVSNAVERWLGLARIQIQTASGSARAEMTIEGVREYGLLRDFLYLRMRGQEKTPVKERQREVESAVVSELRRATTELESIRRLLAGDETAGDPVDD